MKIIGRLLVVAIGLFLALACSRQAYATSSLECDAGDVLLLIHVNSDDTFGDIVIYESSTEKMIYPLASMDSADISWRAYEPPYDNNTLFLLLKEDTDGLPALKVDVRGDEGIIRYKGAERRIRCDWMR